MHHPNPIERDRALAAENATASGVGLRQEEFNGEMQRPLGEERPASMATRGRHKEKAIPSLEVWPSVQCEIPGDGVSRSVLGLPTHRFANAISTSSTPRITDSAH